VLATQNPLEMEGTYPLPEAQLDRFLLLVKVDYPNLEEEQQILMSTTGRDGESLKSLLDARSVLSFQDLVRQVPISEHVAQYAARLCRATRPQTDEAELIRKYAGRRGPAGTVAHPTPLTSAQTLQRRATIFSLCPPVLRTGSSQLPAAARAG
jgi:MoxR-like ATPase